jgi:flagellar motility protein MotE (MotC chaperone)
MPTGYTHDIKKGISFEEFALNCARAFGALVSMRDAPGNTPIPDEIKPSTHYKEKLAKAISELSTIKKLTPNEIKLRRTKEQQKQVDHQKEQLKKIANLKKQYLNMLDKVKKWVPPTKDHAGLKQFMIEQITQSIDFDCNESYYQEVIHQKTDSAWVADKIKELNEDIQYYTKEDKEEIKRCKERTKWIQALKKSLKGGK